MAGELLHRSLLQRGVRRGRVALPLQQVHGQGAQGDCQKVRDDFEKYVNFSQPTEKILSSFGQSPRCFPA